MGHAQGSPENCLNECPRLHFILFRNQKGRKHNSLYCYHFGSHLQCLLGLLCDCPYPRPVTRPRRIHKSCCRQAGSGLDGELFLIRKERGLSLPSVRGAKQGRPPFPSPRVPALQHHWMLETKLSPTRLVLRLHLDLSRSLRFFPFLRYRTIFSNHFHCPCFRSFSCLASSSSRMSSIIAFCVLRSSLCSLASTSLFRSQFAFFGTRSTGSSPSFAASPSSSTATSSSTGS